MKIGFLGAGAMGGAILTGALNTGVVKPEDAYVFDLSPQVQSKYRELGCNIVSNATELGHLADAVVVSLKPQYAEGGLAALEDSLDGKALISIMAGITVETLRRWVKGNVRILRLMPNTPALVGAGAFALDSETDLTDEEKAFAEKLFSSIGIVEWMPEHLIDTACGLSGAGPAYIYIIIEALADGGVFKGLPRPTAKRLAAQTVYGAAKMVLETGTHPDELKDMVCSPGGNTIVGVKTLEEYGVRGALIDAVGRATEKAQELGRNK
ncbi:MAG: pyrroline-5-carboxylate reductase [Mogibacterium sp.]|nr:pyrroline-5-carboxylate reductase [Mogibacterium sp.]MBR2540640.1 pyrroline-5-carboxylate reductase [Mogibacterium sp.]